jgi:hypothetical protein
VDIGSIIPALAAAHGDRFDVVSLSVREKGTTVDDPLVTPFKASVSPSGTIPDINGTIARFLLHILVPSTVTKPVTSGAIRIAVDP